MPVCIRSGQTVRYQSFARAQGRTREFASQVATSTLPANITIYGRGGGVGRTLGLGPDLGVGVGLGVKVGVIVGVAVGVAVGVVLGVVVGVAVGVVVEVALGVAVAVGVGVDVAVAVAVAVAVGVAVAAAVVVAVAVGVGDGVPHGPDSCTSSTNIPVMSAGGFLPSWCTRNLMRTVCPAYGPMSTVCCTQVSLSLH